MSKQEKIVCQGVNFIIRDLDECFEDQDNGFTFHVPFILSADEETVKCARSSIESEIDHGANYEIIREDIGFITNKNRFVGPKEAMRIAIEARQFEYLAYKDIEIRLLERQGFSTSAKISEKLKSEWIDVVSERELKPEDLY